MPNILIPDANMRSHLERPRLFLTKDNYLGVVMEYTTDGNRYKWDFQELRYVPW